MTWIFYAIGAMFAAAGSDLFRKLGANLKDPFTANLFSQIGSFTTAIILFFIFSRKFENNTQGMTYAFLAGVLISFSTLLFFKALSVGPGVSTVAPVIRVGGVMLVAILGILIFREKLTWNIVLGIILTCSGIYVLFLNK